MKVAHIAAGKSLAHFTLWRQKASGGQEIDYIGLAGFLTTRGYYMHRIDMDNYIFIRIMDNIVCQVGKKEMIDDILDFIRVNEPAYIYEFYLKNIGKAVSDDFLKTLPLKDVQFKRDIKSAMQIYFRNCIVKVTKDKISVHDYSTLNGYIWENQIIDRDFNPSIEAGSDFRQFIYNISNRQEDRFKSLCSALGYMIHNYKDPVYCPAIVLNDEVISDNPEGGTGKGLIIKGLKKFRKIITIEGKTFKFEKSFTYQRITKDTQVVAFEDVKKNFDFESLFSVITEGIAIEKKGQTEVYIDFDDSPKIIITTNYALKGSGNSHKRRRFEIELSQYYKDGLTPMDEFEKMFFVQWDDHDYMYFDRFMLECSQLYLREGLIAQELVNLPEKRLAAETCSEFLDFMDETDFKGQKYSRILFYDMFRAENPTTQYAAKTFYGFIRKYVDFYGIVLNETKSNGIRFFQF